MFLLFKRNRIIKKGVAKTVKEFRDRTPRIYEHLFYGAVDIAPQNLVIWYLFETDAELAFAKSSGFCDELTKATISNLLSLGYPAEAFDVWAKDNCSDKTILQGDAEEMQKAITKMLNNKKAMISFTTDEDINRKANGDYHLYFQ